MSSEAVATAAREHAQTEESGPNARTGTDPSNPAAPFAAGAKRLAAVRPRDMVALQRLAGNAAVSRMVARRQAAERVSVQREGPGGGATFTAVRSDKAGPPAEKWSDMVAEGDDPMAKVKAAARLFKQTDTLKPDEKYKGDAKAFHPNLMAIVYMDYIVIVDRTGPLDVRDQKDPPFQAPRNVVVLTDTANFTFWTLQYEESTGAVRAHHDPTLLMYGVEKASIGMYAFIPGLYLGADYAADIRKTIKKATDAGPAKPGQNPDWAKDQVTKLRKRRGKGKGDGPGLGRTGTGTGGGGDKDDPKAVPGGDGQEKKDGGQGGQSKDPKDPKNPGAGGSASTPKQEGPAPGEQKLDGKAPGDPSAPRPKPLQGDPKFQVITTEDGKTHLQMTVDRASTWIDMLEGENDTSLDARIEKAIEKLQDSRDPEKHGKVVNGAKATGFTEPQKGQSGDVGSAEDARKQAGASASAATPGERIPGAKGGANAPGYPARISMVGSGDAAPTTVNGATSSFSMELDYAAGSLGQRDEVFNRMQPIQFYWELIDVTGKTIAEQQETAKKASVGSVQAVRAGAAGANFDRTLAQIREDQANDVAMMQRENWSWEARGAYLALIGLSNSVRMLGSPIGSFVTLVASPLNERAIGFDRTGEFLVRGVATPQVSDAARADPDKHVIRASSVAALAVKVVDVNVRANQSINDEQNQLAKLEKDVNEAKDDKARKEAELKLEAARRGTARGGLASFKASVGGIREQLATARLLKKSMDNHVPDKALTEKELLLELALEQRGATVEDMIRQLEHQLKTMAGDDYEKGEGQGEHEKWVAEQSGAFKGGVEYRPRVVLASEETGQVTPVLAMLGEAKDSTDKHPKWRLVDISSPSSREIYEGESAAAGPAGHSAAIRDVFRAFAENNDYGRGTIAIRLPAQLTSEPAYAGASVDPMMRSAKGGKGRFMQRLQDLATVAEVVGLFVTGPLGIALAAAGGLAGAIIAVDSLVKRARTGHVVEVGTIFDILSVVGGVSAVGGVGTALSRAHLDSLAKAGTKMPGWVGKLEKTERALHIHGVIGNVSQIIIIPTQLILELKEIEGTDGQADARRALAILRAFKSGVITTISATGGIPVGKEKAGAGAREPQSSAPKRLPEGHNADAADAHAAGSGPAKPPMQAPPDAVPSTPKPTAPSGEPGPGKGGEHAAGAGHEVDVTPSGQLQTPPTDAVVAAANERAQLRQREAQQAIETAGASQKPGTPADGTAKPSEPGGSSGPKPAEPGGAKPGEAQPGHAGTPAVDAGPEPVGADVKRREGLIGIAAKAGAKPEPAAQKIRREATKNKAAADSDAVAAVKDGGDFGQVRRDVDAMASLNDGQRAAVTSRLQEARLAVTNEHVGAVLKELQARKEFADLEFHVQDLGTVGFNSDRDITIRVTPKDAAAYAKLGDAERAAMDRRMVQASAEAVPKLYEALDAAGFPANKSLDTNFYTELHEGRVKPADAAEARSIAADQQIVSLTEIMLNTNPEQWKAFVEKQKSMLEGQRGTMSERDIAGLRKRLDAQVAEAEAHGKRLLGDSAGHPTPDARNAALKRAREALVEALKKDPPPTAREQRQLMADVKLLEPDAYGTRAAVEGVVLGGQTLKGASMEKVQGDGFRTRKQIEHGEGEPGPRRLDPETGELREVSAEDEVARRRTEGSANVGHQRPADTGGNSYEQNARRLQVAEAVLGHLLGHLPEPGRGVPTDASAAAKNLGRIVETVGEAGIRGKSDGLSHLPAIVAAKGAADPTSTINKELGSWAREGGVKGWAETNGFKLGTDAQRLDAFVAWSKEQASNLAGRMRIQTETGALFGDVPVGTGRSAPTTPAAPAVVDAGPAPASGGGSAAKPLPGAAVAKPLPSGAAPLTTGEHTATPAGPGPGAGKPADVVPTNHEVDTAFGHLEAGTGPKREPTNMYSVDANALTDARFSRSGGSELDVRNVAKVGVQDAPGGPVTAGQKPPETWLVDPGRANISDPATAADTDFKPNGPGMGKFDTRNAQVVAGPNGERVQTPTGPTFGNDRVVGGAQGATLDPKTGAWVAGAAPADRPHNPLGQDGNFTARKQEDWQAWEQSLGKLTDEQRYALWFYGDDLSGPLNRGLRGQKADQFVSDPLARQAAATALDQSMRPIPFDTVVHRRASIQDFADLKVTDPSQLAAMKGKTYAHEGYTSTAIVPGTWSGELDIVIEVPKGTRGRYMAGEPGAEATNPLKPSPGAPLASMPGEMEFLLERGTRFTIQDAKYDPSTKRWTIEVRVAEQGTRTRPLSNPVALPGTPKKP